MKSSRLRVGREPDNDIVLNHASISRYHVIIEFDGQNYVVTDLNSTNGTFLEQKRLAGESPEVWTPGENVRIGEIWLKLERAAQGQTTQAVAPPGVTQRGSRPTRPVTAYKLVRPDGRPVDASQVKFSEGDGRIGILVDTPTISAAPGSATSAGLVIFNVGQVQDTFIVGVSGVSPTWISNGSQMVSLLPGAQRQIHINFKPPRTPESRAGRHAIAVRISSQTRPSEIVEVRLTLTVIAFSQFTSEIQPSEILSGDDAQVLVTNRGNMPESYALIWEDQSQELYFDPAQIKVNIPAGKTVAVEFHTSLSTPRLFGNDKSHFFTVHINSQAGQTQSQHGEYISRGAIPAWAPVALISLCLLLSCLMFFFYLLMTAPDRAARSTNEAVQTSVALVVQQTNNAITATALATDIAVKGTSSAGTATAIWATADNDMDGLPNAQETQLGTRVDAPDTDLDGLTDGEEVNIRRTNPTNPDTDADGLRDGDEARLGLNPLDNDTDDDGLIDGIDPDPGRAPTFTPVPTLTPTPTPTSTPTKTVTPQIPMVDVIVTINDGTNSATPGSMVSYTIFVTNKGPSPVSNVVVSDSFAAALTGMTWSCAASPGSGCQTPSGAGNINALVNLAPSGTVTFVANGKVQPTATGMLVNSAKADVPVGTIETNSVDNLAIDTNSLTPKVSFLFTITDNRSSILPGQATSYTISLINNGPSAVSGATITDIFPEALTNVTWSCSASSGSVCTPAGVQNGNVNASANVIPGGTVTISANATVKPTAAGNINNTAFLSSPIEPLINNMSALDTTAIIVQSDLVLDVLAPTTTLTTTAITYTVSITNVGPAQATNLVFTAQLPPEVTFISSSPGLPNCSPSAGKLICNFPTLAPASSLKIIIVVQAPPTSGNLSAQMEIKASETDPNPANNLVTINVLVE
jgi:uncharacterized repeat protein (TIGR01451 family)